jgi:hypothetical protein
LQMNSQISHIVLFWRVRSAGEPEDRFVEAVKIAGGFDQSAIGYCGSPLIVSKVLPMAKEALSCRGDLPQSVRL